MDTTERVRFAHSDLTKEIIAAFYAVHSHFRHGFPEAAYQRSMPIALAKRGLTCEREVPYDLFYEGVNVGQYIADLVVEGRVLVELKSVEKLSKAHISQTVNYLKVSGIPLGLLLNFGPSAQIRRLIL
jgi:GxxExxY protein